VAEKLERESRKRVGRMSRRLRLYAAFMSVFVYVVVASGCGGTAASSGAAQSTEAQLTQTQQQLDKANATIAELTKQLEKANATIAELTKQLANTQNDLATLRANLATLGKAYLGIYRRDDQGVYVTGVVQDSPASRAGIPSGCRITHINGRQVMTVAELTEVLSEYLPAENVSVTFTMGTLTRTVAVTLGVAPKETGGILQLLREPSQ